MLAVLILAIVALSTFAIRVLCWTVTVTVKLLLTIIALPFGLMVSRKPAKKRKPVKRKPAVHRQRR